MVSITLTSSMRSNLLALKEASALQSQAQERMSTGQKVNSPIDNPSAYYTASSLHNRASDLGSLLDGMGHAVQNLKTVSSALEAAGGFLEQAAVVGAKALEKLDAAEYTTKFEVDKDWLISSGINPADIVSSKEELTERLRTASAGDKIIIWGNISLSDEELVLKDGVSLSGADRVIKDLGLDEWAQVGAADKGKITFNSSSSAVGISVGNNSELSDLAVTMNSSAKTAGTGVINANDKSNVVLRNISIDYTSTSSGNEMSAAISAVNGNVSLYGDMNLKANGQFMVGIYGNGGTITQDESSVLDVSISGTSAKGGYSGNMNFAGTVNIDIKGPTAVGFEGSNLVSSGILNIKLSNGSGGSALSRGSSVLSGQVNITTDGYSSHSIFNNGVTFKSDLVLMVRLDKPNTHLINNMGRATINWEAGATIGVMNSGSGFDNVYRASSGGSTNAQADYDDLSLPPFNWDRVGNFPQQVFNEDLAEAFSVVRTARTAAVSLQSVSTLGLADGKISLAEEEKSFNEVLNQYNKLINDSSYKGINLLREQNLKIDFDETRRSGILIKGVDATIEGLGVGFADWSGGVALRASLDSLTRAVDKLRSYAEEFGTYNSIITTREGFTKSLIEVLQEGADKLTLADMNQEAANILALQTRQQLATNSLSLASQAAQSILKLF